MDASHLSLAANCGTTPQPQIEWSASLTEVVSVRDHFSVKIHSDQAVAKTWTIQISATSSKSHHHRGKGTTCTMIDWKQSKE